jgi:hypothetical protein
LDFKLLFVRMNNHFNNLYEYGGCISCRLTSALFLVESAQRRKCLFSKKLGEIYNKMGRFRLLGGVCGRGWETAVPHKEFSAPSPKLPQNRLRRLGGGEGTSGDALRACLGSRLNFCHPTSLPDHVGFLAGA